MSVDAIAGVQREALWFEPGIDGFGALLDSIGDARLVLIVKQRMEPTSSTELELTKTLITRKEFNLIAVEAEWPDAYRANRWVRHLGDDASVEAALGNFMRFPGKIDA